MTKYFISLLVLVFSMSLIVGCGGSKKSAKGGDSAFEEINDPFQALTDMANEIIDAGGVASVGQGTSKRMDLAKKKAVLAAQGNLAGILKTKVSKLNKSFQEEIGSGDDTEINEAFSDVVKAVAKGYAMSAVLCRCWRCWPATSMRRATRGHPETGGDLPDILEVVSRPSDRNLLEPRE